MSSLAFRTAIAVAATVGSFALLSLWYHPLGLPAIEPVIGAGFVLVPLLIGGISGYLTRRAELAPLNGVAAVAGALTAWVLTIAIDPQALGDSFWITWLMIALLAFAGHLVGSAIGLRRGKTFKRMPR